MADPPNETATPLTTKERVDAILALGDACWRDFNTRRSFEWKVTIGLWTAQVLFAGFVFRAKIDSLSKCGVVFLGAIFAGIIYVYAFRWTKGIWKSHGRNKKEAREYWKLADEVLGVPSKGNEGGKPDADSFMSDYSNGSQVWMTILLAVLDIWCVLVKFHKL